MESYGRSDIFTSGGVSVNKGTQSRRRRLYLILALILLIPFAVYGGGVQASEGAAEAEPTMVRFVAT